VNNLLVRRVAMVSMMGICGLALTACFGKGVEGTYENASEKATIELQKGGKAIITTNGKRDETTWEMNGKDKVVLHAGPGGMANLVMDINSDGDLSAYGGAAGVFKKK
jgi:hypothetical protein